jgi:acetylornithine/succinyldiaminopimelate/putrescine aminotransferase
VLRFMPSLLVSAEEIQEMCGILRRAWAAKRASRAAS